jgi:hypothetical protein
MKILILIPSTAKTVLQAQPALPVQSVQQLPVVLVLLPAQQDPLDQ